MNRDSQVGTQKVRREVPRGLSRLLMCRALFQVVPSTELGSTGRRPDVPEIRLNK